MLQAIMTFTRTNTDIPFYQASQACKDYQKVAYEDTGKRISFDYKLSDDLLKLYLIVYFSNQEAYNEFYNDPQNQTLQFGPRGDHCQANNISISPNVIKTGNFAVTVGFTRPSVDVPFYKASDESKAYQKSTYDSTGKRVGSVYRLSDNSLTMTVTTYWKDSQSYNEFRNDAQVISSLAQPRTVYNTQNNIQTVPATTASV
jgi:hypothetical protein